jgi:26S proteasome regulatory subunit N6
MLRAEEKDETKVVVVEDPEFVCPEFDSAVEQEESSPETAIKIFQEIISTESNFTDENMVKVIEQSIYHLGKLYANAGNLDELKALFVSMRPFFQHIPKSKTAKITRTLTQHIAETPGATLDLQVEILTDAINWCKEEKRTFLKQRIETRLAQCLMELKRFLPTLKLLERLIREVKKFDDKLLMVEIYLIESKTHLLLQNTAKAKGALTSARAAAVSVYCPPLLQAQIDTMAGVLCAEEGDFKTAFSYFYEAFEGYNTVNDAPKAVKRLKYMLMAKIMTKNPEDVYNIIRGKSGVKYAGREVESMRVVADAYKARSIEDFEKAYVDFKAELVEDEVVSRHLGDLKEHLVEQNLIRLIEPFSRVELAHIARLIRLPLSEVEPKLSEMILDHKLNGILDQGTGVLIVFDETQPDDTYTTALETVKELSSAVDKLYGRAQRISRTSII